MTVKKVFIDLMIKIMPKNKYKAKVTYFFNDNIYLFMSNVKKTTLRQFLNPRIFSVKIFYTETYIAKEVQINSWSFKSKRLDIVSLGYSYKLMGIYRIKDIKIRLLLRLEKK